MGRYLELADQALAQWNAGAVARPSAPLRPRFVFSAGRCYDKNDINDQRSVSATIVTIDEQIPPEWQTGITRLQATLPPDGVPAARWCRFLDDTRRIHEQGWLARAAALGWSAVDVFGLDPAQPCERVDQAGLAWLIDGGQLAALAADRAAIRLPTGSIQTYYRNAHQQGVPAWQLADT